MANLLDKLNIHWEYEFDKFLYYNPDKSRNAFYLPDFYLPKYNLILEIKPRRFIDKSVIRKAKSVLARGFKFKFVDYDKINENFLDTFCVV